MKKTTVKIHEIAKDGLPDMDKLTGRVSFIFDGIVLSGWPLSETSDDGDNDVWEGDSAGTYSGVTHWIEWPKPIWDLEK